MNRNSQDVEVSEAPAGFDSERESIARGAFR